MKSWKEIFLENSSIIRQKGESQIGVTGKQSTSNFPKNEHSLLPVSGGKKYPGVSKIPPVSPGKKYPFFGKFGALCFLVTPVLRFALLHYYRRVHQFVPWLSWSISVGRAGVKISCIILQCLRKYYEGLYDGVFSSNS